MPLLYLEHPVPTHCFHGQVKLIFQSGEEGSIQDDKWLCKCEGGRDGNSSLDTTGDSDMCHLMSSLHLPGNPPVGQ